MSQSGPVMDIKELEYILSLLKKNDVTEFDLTHDGTQVKVKRGSVLEFSAASGNAELQKLLAAASSSAGSASSVPASSLAPVVESDNLVKVESPMVGTFYRRPSPDSEPFVREGDVIKKGQTLCIVEAMKLMNEISAPCSGRVDKILLAEGQVAEYGETIFLIDPDS
jgi:acetyl-CoA carboxylase biotin carboxyl carrier protein